MFTGSGQDTCQVEDSRFPLSRLGLYRLMYGNDCALYVVARDASEAFLVVPCFGWLVLSSVLGLSKLWTIAVMIFLVAPGQSIFFLLLSRRFPWFDED